VDTREILNEREKTHGDYEAVSLFHTTILRFMQDEIKKMRRLDVEPIKSTHFLALEMICLKMARIVCGDPNHADHWDDIAGYAMLAKGERENGHCKACAINIECFGVPCDGHLQTRADRLVREISS
jgi:hypothetical protein